MAGLFEVAAAKANWEFQRACLAPANFGILRRDGATANTRLVGSALPGPTRNMVTELPSLREPRDELD